MEEEIEGYGECMKNHAANLGSYATDGCCEYTVDDTNPSSLICDACGCHRNFHRKITYVTDVSGGSGNKDKASPEVIEVIDDDDAENNVAEKTPESDRSGKKRPRTKFTDDQKGKMLAFAEKIGWKVGRKHYDSQIENFCKEIGVTRQVFKVWMHNHRNNSNSSGQASSQ